MILYNETVNVENSVVEEWLVWMKEVHIPEVMATGYFLSNHIARLINEVDNGGTTYAVQFYCRSLEDLNDYQRDHGTELGTRQAARYGERALSFKSVLEIVAENVERNNG